jgi:hypothetical protein
LLHESNEETVRSPRAAGPIEEGAGDVIDV